MTALDDLRHQRRRKSNHLRALDRGDRNKRLRKSLSMASLGCFILAAMPEAAWAQSSPAQTTKFEYDAQGNLLRTIAAPLQGNLTTSAEYDRLNRPTRHIDPVGNSTQIGYIGSRNIRQITDPRGLITQYARTGFDELLGLTSPDTGTTIQTVDAAGNILTRSDSRGVQAQFSYDALNRMTSATFARSGDPTVSEGWTYDQTGGTFGYGVGRLTSIQDPAGSTAFGYDSLGRIVRATQTVQTALAGTPVTHTTSYSYKSDGKLLVLG